MCSPESISKFINNAEYSEDYSRIAAVVSRIARTGAQERYFRREGKMNDSVVALPVLSDRISELMNERRLSKKQFADALGRRPSEITKWLSGQHNFTIATLGMLSSFFGQPIITVG